MVLNAVLVVSNPEVTTTEQLDSSWKICESLLTKLSKRKDSLLTGWPGVGIEGQVNAEIRLKSRLCLNYIP